MTTLGDNPLANLPTLAAIATQGSFSKAADVLGLNRAAISKRIAQMERALGVAVLARTTRKVELTQAGKALLVRHHEAETLLQMAVDEARGTMLTLGGTVRVVCVHSSLAVHLIGPALFAYAQATPGIRIDLDAALGGASVSQPDIELRITDAPPLDQSARLLAPVSWRFQATHSYVARHGMPHSPQDMQAHRFIVPAKNDVPATFEHRHSGRTVVASPSNTFTCNIQEVVFEIVKRGEAIGLLPNYLSATAPTTADLTEVLTDWQLRSLPAQSLYAIHAPAKYQRAATRAVLDHLSQVCSHTW